MKADPVQPADEYKPNTGKTKARNISTMSQGFNGGSMCWTNSPTYPFLQFIPHIQVTVSSTCPDLTTVFHARLYGRFIDIKTKFRRKKLHRMYQGSNFLEMQFNLEKKGSPSILKDYFSSRTDPFIFTSIALKLLDQASKTS